MINISTLYFSITDLLLINKEPKLKLKKYLESMSSIGIQKCCIPHWFGNICIIFLMESRDVK